MSPATARQPFTRGLEIGDHDAAGAGFRPGARHRFADAARAAGDDADLAFDVHVPLPAFVLVDGDLLVMPGLSRHPRSCRCTKPWMAGVESALPAEHCAHRIQPLVLRLLNGERGHQVEHRRRKPGGARERGGRADQRVDLHGAAELKILQDRRLVVRRGARARDALDSGIAALGDGVGLIQQARDDVGQRRIVAHARAVWPVNRHSTDIDMLVSSFDQMVSLICATCDDWIDAPLSAARSRSIRSLWRSSHSPTSSMLRSGERLATTPGAITSLEEKITPPMIRSLGIAARSWPPGSRKPRSGGGG